MNSKEWHLLEIEIFCNVISVFSVTIDQSNASLMNKSINFPLTPKLWMAVYVYETRNL